MIMHVHEKINYVELPSNDLKATRMFFQQVFGWEFTDFGSNYTAFTNQGIDGGFYYADKASSTVNGSALLVFYSERLEQTRSKIEQAGGKIVKPVFVFPGGRRFHFCDPVGNEYAVWTDK